MAIEIETLVLQAKQLSRAQRVQLIARLSADLAQDVPDEPKSHQSLDELLLTAKPWQGLKHPLENQPNPEVTDFLEMRNLTMRFGGLMAVDGLSFKVAHGSIHGLIGPNASLPDCRKTSCT